MRLIDADELIEHAYRDKLDSRKLIVQMIENSPTIKEIPTKIPINIFEHLIEHDSCEDAINRQELLDAFWKLDIELRPNAIDAILKMINDISPVTPQQKTGRWITTRTFMHDGEFYCNKCKCDSPNNEKWDYCPNCGAKMREVKDES